MDKKKYDVTIAGVEMSIISDEREEFVQKLVSKLDKQITDITIQNKRCSKLDAAILVALDLSSEKAKAEKRVRNLEAQIALYDANLRRMREDNIKLKSAMLGSNKGVLPDDLSDADDGDAVEEKKSADEGEGITQLSIGADEASNTADEPKADARRDGLRQIAELLGSRKKENEDSAALAADAKDDGAADAAAAADESAEELKEDKLRQIETLLRRNDI